MQHLIRLPLHPQAFVFQQVLHLSAAIYAFSMALTLKSVANEMPFKYSLERCDGWLGLGSVWAWLVSWVTWLVSWLAGWLAGCLTGYAQPKVMQISATTVTKSAATTTMEKFTE